MQKRHTDRYRYFLELSITSEKYFIPYISKYYEISKDTKVLEIGCGEGGNLLPFAKLGCHVTGIDISVNRINSAKEFFKWSEQKGDFIQSDLFKYNFNHKFDIIICHDVFEHIADKENLLTFLESNLKANGVVFLAFPAWQMPFGGHQQICRSKVVSKLPFVHLLPNWMYLSILKLFKESNDCIYELINIKSTRITIEQFLTLIKKADLHIENSLLWFINPHYQQKFNMTPIRLSKIICKIIYLRNFFTTSYWCILKLNHK